MYMGVSILKGKTLTEVTHSDDTIIFTTTDGNKYKLYHDQDCCETVGIEDIVGNLKDLVGSPIIIAEEISNDEPGKEDAEHFTWTFYKFATVKGYVTIRWYGESNGYYSEGVDFEEIL